MKQPSLFDLDDAGDTPRPAEPPGAPVAREPPPPDQAARDFATDPGNDVVLEASAGTGKTRVLVDRYVRLIESGVDPRNVLAITFTRKAAAEMRERVLSTLRARAEIGSIAPDRWTRLSARLSDIEISTIDAFCFSLLREFPLEADVDPAFEVADETEIARFANEAMDVTLRTARALLERDEFVRLLFTRVKQPVLRAALASLLDRRQVARPAIATFLARHPNVTDTSEVARRFVARVKDVCTAPAIRRAIVDDGPAGAAEFCWLAEDLGRLDEIAEAGPARVQLLRRRIERYFLTQAGKPRQRLSRPYSTADFASADARKRHEQALGSVSAALLDALEALDADLNVLLARGLQRVLAIAISAYDALLEEHALLDFAGMLDRSVALLERQEEFARSRLKLQARYHHLLIDEFQDTSRRQWRLIDQLIDAWAEGEGPADAPTSVFIVGDRKQSIYRFRHAEVTLLDDAIRRVGALRGRPVRQAITTSFRAVPELLAFVNVLSDAMQNESVLEDRWRYDQGDRFPVEAVDPGGRRDGAAVLGLVGEPSMAGCASAVAEEVARLLEGKVPVRERGGPPRAVRPDDIAILFRARAGHQYFEDALEARGVRTYVYKGLGFFDAPEVQDLQALIRFLARPDSDLRAAELLRSRFLRISDAGLAVLAPALSAALLQSPGERLPEGLSELDAECLARAREHAAGWLSLVDRVPPSELLDIVLRESAYVHEMRGRRLDQARENVKKLRALVRRVENRGYATIGRLAAYFDTLSAGEDSNAMIEAAGAVNLMTIHAAKGLEFPIVVLVNVHAPGRGRPPGFSVIERGPVGLPEVAFNTSQATKLEEARETEELRRLLYVAVTRARDRLYLAAQVDAQGRIRRGARSLGSLLPPSLADLFAAPATSADGEVIWATPQGSFAWRVCRAPGHAAPVAADVDDPVAAPVKVAALPATGLTLVNATAIERLPVDTPEAPAASRPVWRSTVADDRLVGTLTHRLFQRQLPADAGPETLSREAERLLNAADRVDLAEPALLIKEAVGVYQRLRDGDLMNLLASGTSLYEVPFSYVPPDRPGECIRGVIDCVVVSPDGRVTVVELKTGSPRPEHRAQAELYGRAVAAAFGTPNVDVRLCYPAAPDLGT
jgi:ATP-dependent helicase/nuclease subunit A